MVFLAHAIQGLFKSVIVHPKHEVRAGVKIHGKLNALTGAYGFRNPSGGMMVAEDRSALNSRQDIIDLGSWQIALVRALDAYNAKGNAHRDIEKSAISIPDSAS